MLHRRRLRQRLIDRRLQRQQLAAPPAAIGRDHNFGLRIVVAIGHGLRRKAAKDDAMHRADASAGQHRDRQLRRQRHIDRNHVPFFHAQRFQDVGELADFTVQL